VDGDQVAFPSEFPAPCALVRYRVDVELDLSEEIVLVARSAFDNVEKSFTNIVIFQVAGEATAGKPQKPDPEVGKVDKYHSADSFAGAYVDKAKLFVRNTADTGTPFELLSKQSVAYSGTMGVDQNRKDAKVPDPLFFTVTDLDTGVAVTEKVMTLDIEARAADIDAASLAPVFAEAGDIGLLLLGVGRDRWIMPEALHELFHARKLSVEAARTGTAVSTYNILLGEGRRVSAALIAVA
jgi:uncharacterized protein